MAFIDILGFGELVKRADSNPDLRRDIVDALKKVRQLPRSIPSTELRAQNFSDSLILSTDRTPEGLWRLVLSLDALAWSLLQIGVLARGAIALGGVHHDDRFVFGLGVNEAYRLESTVAKFRRVILGRRVVEDADRYASQDQLWQVYRTSRLLRDVDGVTFVHYLNDLEAANLHPRTTVKPSEDNWTLMAEQVRQLIQSKIDETLDAPDIYDKVRWLGRYWNGTVASHTVANTNPAFAPVTLAGEETRGPILPFRNRV